MLTLLTLLSSLSLFADPHPERAQVVLVRSRLAPLAVVAPDGAERALGPMSPRGFGLARGRLRFLAASSELGVVVVEVAGPEGGAIFALPIDGGAPVRLAETRALGLDVALSPDGRRLLYVDGTTPRVVTITTAAPGRPPLEIPAPPGLPEGKTAEPRIERPRWLDAHTIVYERATTDRAGRTVTTVELAAADGVPRAQLLIPPARGRRTQDRLAAVVGGSVLAYRDGVLRRFSPDGDTALGDRHAAAVVAPWPNTLGRLEHALLALGGSGVERPLALARIDPDGTVTPLAEVRATYLDPLVLPGRGAALRSVRTPRGWVVERVAMTTSEGPLPRVREVSPPHPAPIQLVTAVPGSTLVAGCRGGEIVLVDATGNDPPRVLAYAPENPSCAVRAATSRHVVFDRKVGEASRIELLPIATGPVHAADPGANWVGAVGDEIIVQRGWEGSATIVRESDAGRVTTLVPWQAEGISQARRTPDGRAVVFVTHGVPGWRAVPVDRPGAIVEVTGDVEGVGAIGLTDERLVGWEPGRTRYLSWRLDGSDRGRPTVVLEDVPFVAPFSADLGRVIGGRADGAILSARVDGSERARPVVVMRAGGASWARGMLAYDPLHRRVVALRVDDGRETVVSAAVTGEDAARPRVLGAPRPPPFASLHGLEVVASGDVWLEYATDTTAVPHPTGGVLLRWDGSGPSADPTPPVRLPMSTRAPILDAAPTPDDYDGAETRTPL